MSENLELLAEKISLPANTLGSENLTIQIADFRIRLEGLDPNLRDRIAERYDGFLGGGDEKDIFVAKVASGKGCFIPSTEDGFLRIEELEKEDGFYFFSTDFSGFAQWENKQGFVLLADAENIRFSVVGVENYLMRIFSYMVLNEGGFFLHACGLEKNGKAYVFYGPSGSGKSAVATLSPELGIMSDDMILIFKKDGTFYASSTPFWGAISRMMRTKGIFPIGGCYKINKTTETSLEPMKTIKAITTLFSSALFGSFSQYRSGLLFENIKNYVRQNDVHQLDLPLKPVFWDKIEE